MTIPGERTAADARFQPIAGCELHGELGEIGSRLGGTLRARGARCSFDDLGHGFVRAAGRVREVASAILLAGGECSQPAVQPPPPRRQLCGVGNRSEQRMRKANSLAVEHEHVGSDSASYCVLVSHRSGDEILRRRRQRRRHEQRLARVVGEGRNPLAHDLRQRLRKRQRSQRK